MKIISLLLNYLIRFCLLVITDGTECMHFCYHFVDHDFVCSQISIIVLIQMIRLVSN
jgi:hypothetical protein